MNPFYQAVLSLLEPLLERSPSEVSLLLEIPPDPALGDLALPCFQLAKTLRKNPILIAQDLAQKVPSHPLMERVEALQGYVNFYYSPSQAMEYLFEQRREKKALAFLSDPPTHPKTILVDYSSPNIAKPFHTGHLRATHIGNALYRLLSFLGHQCVGINYLGDWGTQFGKLMVAYLRWKNEEWEWGPEEKSGERAPLRSLPTLEDLNKLYVRFHTEAKNNPGLEEEARRWFRKLETEDEDAQKLWKRFCDISMGEFDQIYQSLDTSFDVVEGESQYVQDVPAVEEVLKSKGLLVESEGAKIVSLDAYQMPPFLVRKSDEGTLYAIRDLAALLKRYERYHFDEMLYVVGRDQELHFRQLFKVAELLGTDLHRRAKHVEFGMIRFQGEKMSTREGKIVLVKDMLDQAIQKSKAIMDERQVRPSHPQTAQWIGLGALTFFNLKNRRHKDVEFNWEEVLNFDGETGPYLQYTHVRLCSIERKYRALHAAGKESDFSGSWPLAKASLLVHPDEAVLSKLILRFPDVLNRAAAFYEPSFLSTYLLGLAQRINHYYETQRILTEDAALTQSRLLLCGALQHVLSTGLCLLGLRPLEEM